MNREIKFRAWWQPKVLEYHCGELVNPPRMLYMGDDRGTKTGLDCCVYANQGQNVILMQYTGLKDKNGKEIYEGDITNNGEVFWNDELGNEQFGFMLKDIYKNKYGIRELHYLDAFTNPLEVIGNVWENPDLLGGKLK